MPDEIPTAPAWLAGLDQEHRDLATAKGYDKLEGDALATSLLKAYKGSEYLRGKMAGGDPNGTVALPKEGDAEGAKAFWQKLGAPGDPTGYTLDGVKRKDGSALDAGYVDAARQAAAATNMPAHMLQSFLGALQPHFDGAAEAAQASKTVDIEANRRLLSHEWGPNEARNKFIAGRAMDTLKDYLPNEAIGALESLPGVGYVGIHKLMLHLGDLLGEGRFVSGAPAGTMNPDQAADRLAALTGDAGWRARFVNGDAAAAKEKSDLIAIIHGARR